MPAARVFAPMLPLEAMPRGPAEARADRVVRIARPRSQARTELRS